jgi:hypothetical protein
MGLGISAPRTAGNIDPDMSPLRQLDAQPPAWFGGGPEAVIIEAVARVGPDWCRKTLFGLRIELVAWALTPWSVADVPSREGGR